ncbi:isocitrate/isopropylmalate family dehydrogenase [Streptomyces sp. M10(2022)]
MEAGLLTPLHTSSAEAHALARQARRDWDAALSLISRHGPGRRGGALLDVLLIRAEFILSDTGAEFSEDSHGVGELRRITTEHGTRPLREGAVTAVHTANPQHIRKFMENAIGVCRDKSIERITVAHKGNSIKYTDGLFALTARKAMEELVTTPSVVCDSLIIDHMAAELVRNPDKYRAVLTHSAFADLLAAVLDGQLAGDRGGVCTTLDTAGRPQFGYDTALDTTRPAHGSGDTARVRRLRSTLLAGAELAGHLGFDAARVAIGSAVTAVEDEDTTWPAAERAARHAVVRD